MTRSEEIRADLVDFLTQWKEGNEDPERLAKIKDPDLKEENALIGLLQKTLTLDNNAPSEKLSDYQNLWQRIENLARRHDALWEQNKEPRQWQTNERRRLKEYTKGWEEVIEEENEQKSDDLQNQIEALKDTIRQHLGNGKNELAAYLPPDKKETADKVDLIKTKIATGLIAFGNCPVAPPGKEKEHATGAYKAKAQAFAKERKKQRKLAINLKVIGVDVSELEQLLDEGDAAVLAGKADETQKKNARGTRLIDISLKNDNLANYREFVKVGETIDKAEPHLTPFAGGFATWDTLKQQQKDLDKEIKKHEEEAKTGDCACLHCSHGMDNGTGKGCPGYEHSRQAIKEGPAIATGGEGDRGKPPEGWQPFYNGDGTPLERDKGGSRGKYYSTPEGQESQDRFSMDGGLATHKITQDEYDRNKPFYGDRIISLEEAKANNVLNI